MQLEDTFSLDPVSPADREAAAERTRRLMRERNRQARDEAKARGENQVHFFLHKELIKQIDTVAKREGYPNRSLALTRILHVMQTHPEIKQELGL